MATTLSTIDEVLDALPESTRIEVHDGKVVVNPPPTGGHQLVVDTVQDWLKAHLVHRGRVSSLGATGGAPMRQSTVMLELAPLAHRFRRVLTGIGIRVDDDQRFIPDVVVVAPGSEIDPSAVWQQPDRFELVVEVVSPSSRRDDPGIKRDQYHRAGLSYWLIDPDARTIQCFDDDGGLDPDALAAELWPGSA